jgi:hypothetical protein
MAYMTSANNNTLKNGYSTEYSQGEVTIVAVFDYRDIQSRKNLSHGHNGNKSQMYPNVQDINLGMEENEFVIAWKRASNQTRSGAQMMSVFTSVNGMDLAPYNGSIERAMRDLMPVGVNKTVYRLEGTPSTGPSGPSYAMESGIGICASGVRSLYKHTGDLPIAAGDLVCIFLPPLPNGPGDTGRISASGRSYVSPNNPGHGQPIGKYLMVTAPFNPSDYAMHLQTVHALFRIPKNGAPTAGVSDLVLEELAKNEPGGLSARQNTDPQEESGRMWYSMFGIFFTMLEQLLNEYRLGDAAFKNDLNGLINPGDSEETIHGKCEKLMALIGVHKLGAQNRKVALQMADAVMLNNCVSQALQKTVVNTFKRRNPAAFSNDKNTYIALANAQTINNSQRYGAMCWDAIGNLFGTLGSVSYEKCRFIVGRARNSALKGDTLDLNLSNNSRPISI